MDGPAGHALRARPHPVDLVRTDRRRHRTAGDAVAEHDGSGHRTGHVRLLRWPLGGQQLGWQPRRHDARRSLGAVPVCLLPWLERAGRGGWAGLHGLGLAGGVRLRCRADPDRRRYRLGAAATRPAAADRVIQPVRKRRPARGN
ncbi:hypothetical protein G6F32_016395 [Rhizopus arrhizus]|nr:hypothetical protein G6F32_016395 [Rhizopus arrhizus]